jgi:hypothetical protein
MEGKSWSSHAVTADTSNVEATLPNRRSGRPVVACSLMYEPQQDQWFEILLLDPGEAHPVDAAAHRRFYCKALPECNGASVAGSGAAPAGAREGRGAHPEPPGSLATPPPRAVKHNAVRWLLFCLTAAASSLQGRCRLRGDVGLPLSHQGDGERPGGPPPGSENNAGFSGESDKRASGQIPGALCQGLP